MTNEEAISVIENEIQIDVRLCTDKQVDKFQTALYMAISALRAEPTGKALTLEQLREMDGKPVWIERNESPHDGKWFIVDHADVENPDRTLYTKEGVTYSDYGVYFTAYAHPRAHIDREGWTADWVKHDGYTECSKCDYWYDSPDGEEDGDRPVFCPACGRAMTPEAWAELEKRVRG